MKRTSVFLLCIASLLAFRAGAQRFRFISYDVTDGLSQNSVHCIFQDSYGLLWVGTQDGLNSFDGHNFTTYRFNPNDTTSISDQFILSITEDAQGYLWVGTRNGLNRMNRRTGKFRRYYIEQDEKKFIGGDYPLLVQNRRSEIFVRHAHSSVFLDAKEKIITTDSSLNKSECEVFDRNGILWSVRGATLGTYDLAKPNAKWTPVATLPAKLVAYTSAAAIDSSQTLWLYISGTQNQLHFFDVIKRRWRKEKITLPATVNHINIAKDGTGWVATLHGIYLVKNYAVTQKIDHSSSAGNSLPASSILCTYEDRKGNMWIGSAYNGLAFYHPRFDQYRFFSTASIGAAVTCAVKEAQHLWIGTTNGLLMKQNDSSSTFNSNRVLFAGKKITGLAKDKQNQLWVAVENEGLYVMKDNRIVCEYHQNDSLLQARSVLNLFADSHGRVIVCTMRGYYIFSDAKHWTPFFMVPVVSTRTGGYSLQAFEDREHNIWISKNEGIDILDENLHPKKILTSGSTGSDLDRTIVAGCAQDIFGNIWIATLSSGIYRYNNGKLTQYTTANGLNTNVTYGVACDEKGRVWVITTSGMNVYDPARKRFFSLDSKDGLPSDSYTLGAIGNDGDGNLLVGSQKGLIIINTNNVTLQNNLAEAQISDVRIDGESAAELHDPFILEPGYKSISFSLSLKEALQPRQIIYQYRMLGVEDQWQTLPPGVTRISYNNLPFEKLTLQVRAAYSILDMQFAPVDSLQVIVKPMFIQTTLFKLLALLALVIALVILFLLITRAQKRKHQQQIREQQKLQQERERISRDLHDNIGAYTSALISGIDLVKNGEVKREELDELSEYADNIMGYLRETIWVLNHESVSLTSFSDSLKNYAQKITKHYPSASFRFAENIEEDRHLFPNVSLNLFRILQEALQNACKHAGSGQIAIAVESGNKIRFSVSDTGIGMQGNSDGNRFGMRNMRLRAEEIGFTLTVISSPGMGTTIMCEES